MPVSYVPSRLEGPALSAANLRYSPWKLLLSDIWLVFKLTPYLPFIFINNHRHQKATSIREGTPDVALQVIIFFLTFITAGIGLQLIFYTTGIIFICFSLLSWGVFALLARPLNSGPRVTQSNVPLAGYPKHPKERWIFVNGICASSHWLQEDINMISTIFRRPVMGIHNRTYGVIFDIVECLVQRDFSYMTSDVRIAYNTLKTTLLDPECERLVLIAHSQGGIIVAAALDALYAELEPSVVSKLELYTFGSAANHLNNPPRSAQTPGSKRRLTTVEHYANGKDFVARLGVLNFATTTMEDREAHFVGKVFTRIGEGGHLFNEHYLRPMFYGKNPRFLDEVVKVETGVAVERAVAEERMLERVVDGLEHRTVREMSKLWMYRNGGVPGDDQDDRLDMFLQS